MKINGAVFVRHAESVGNILSADERADLGEPNHAYALTEKGKSQAFAVGEYLARQERHFDVCFHSTFRRTRETLGCILSKMSCKSRVVVEDARLDEKWDGIFHELSQAEIRHRYSEQIRLRKRSGYYHYRAPGGENCVDVEMRIRSFLFDLDRFYDGKRVLLVVHGNWFLLMQKVLHRMTVDEFSILRDQGCKNCSITWYETWDQPLPVPVIPWEGLIAESSSSFA